MLIDWESLSIFLQSSLGHMSLPFICQLVCFHFPDHTAMPLHTHHQSEYILTILYPSFWDCSIANLAAWTYACCADLPMPWSVRICPSVGLQAADFQCSLPARNMDAPSVNQPFVCELSHLSVPQ
jgi:hypothetical protein